MFQLVFVTNYLQLASLPEMSDGWFFWRNTDTFTPFDTEIIKDRLPYHSL